MAAIGTRAAIGTGLSCRACSSCASRASRHLIWMRRAKGRTLRVRLGPTGFDMGCETAGAYRGAGSSLNYLQTYSCQSRQLRSSRLIAVETQAARADANVWV